MKVFIVLSALLGIVFADELLNCQCGSDYHPVINSEGIAQCHGIVLKSILPCNTVTRPRCVCSGDVTGITNDNRGTRCSIYRRGVEVKHWDCENTEEWEKFFEQNPNQKTWGGDEA